MALKFEAAIDEGDGAYILPWKMRLGDHVARPEVGDWVQAWMEDEKDGVQRYVDLVVVDVRKTKITAQRRF